MDVGLVCDACSTFNPMGSSECTACSAGLSLGAPPKPATPSQDLEAPTRPPGAPTPPSQQPEPVRHAVQTPPASAMDSRGCPSCGASNPPGNRFCGACGHMISEETQPSMVGPNGPPVAAAGPAANKRTMFFGAMQQARAKLVLIKGDGLDGVSFTLAGDSHVAGRLDAPLLFEEDPFLSPTHANFFYRDTDLLVRDEGSVNGVYIRIRGAHPISFNDRFLIGEQVIEAQETTASAALEPATDGTYFYSSPRGESTFRLQQLLRGGGSGLAFRAPGPSVSLGREGNDINFPDDPFISGRHARVSIEGGQLTLTDLGSKNGTFLRVRSEYKLQHGDYVFMGQQLLRVEIV